MSKELVLQAYDFNLEYARHLIADLTDEQMTATPGPGLENHPAFLIGHLVTGSAMMARTLGQSLDLPAGWKDLFARRGPSDTRRPEADTTCYPTRQELLAELERQHTRVRSLLLAADEATLQSPADWRFSSFMPTTLGMLTFMATLHEAMHLGQLAAWRRAYGLPQAMGGL